MQGAKWVKGRGSWVVGRGWWVVGGGSWVVGRGSWVVVVVVAVGKLPLNDVLTQDELPPVP